MKMHGGIFPSWLAITEQNVLLTLSCSVSPVTKNKASNSDELQKTFSLLRFCFKCLILLSSAQVTHECR